MPREKEGYRDTIADLRARGYPAELTISQVCEVLDICYNTARKRFKFNSANRIAIADLARQICI